MNTIRVAVACLVGVAGCATAEGEPTSAGGAVGTGGSGGTEPAGGNSNPGGGGAQNGEVTCALGTNLCGDACVIFTTDSDHCGACDNACDDGEVCSGGECALTCTEPFELCGAECADTASDAAHCGDCGTECPEIINGVPGCSESECGLGACDDGYAQCDGDEGCDTHVSEDPANCGICGTACGEGEICVAGQCGDDPLPDWTQVNIATTLDLVDVAGSGSPYFAAYAMSYEGAVFKYAGTNFFAPVPVPVPTGATFTALATSIGGGEVSIVGLGGVVVVKSRTPDSPVVPVWHEVSLGTTVDLMGTYFAANQVYAVGAGGAAFKFSSSGTPSPAAIDCEGAGTLGALGGYLAGVGHDILWAVGQDGSICKFDSASSTAFELESSGTSADLYGVFVDNDSNSGDTTIYAVGTGGTILFSSGDGTWTAQSSGVTTDLYGVFGRPGDFRAVGDAGVILHSTGDGTWTAEDSGTTELLARGITLANNTFGVSSYVVGTTGTLLTR